MNTPGEGNAIGDEGTAIHPRWASRQRPPPKRSGSFHYLLDLDVDLAEALDLRMRLVARPAATAMIFDADVGEVKLAERLAAARTGPGVLVLDGVIAVNVQVGDRVAAELLGAGDIVEAYEERDDLLACATEWRGLMPTRFAVLDDGFVQRVRPWPQIMQALLTALSAGRATSTCSVRSPLSRAWRCAWRCCCGTWRPAGAGWSPAASDFRCRSRTSCSAG